MQTIHSLLHKQKERTFMNKQDISKRHAVIKAIITSKDIANQTELVKELKAKKILVTQATLSRDLVELGIIRIPTEDGYRYELQSHEAEAHLRTITAEEIVSIQANENIIVIKTFPGRAQGVAVIIDGKKDTTVLGTLAGDDTIIVVPASVRQIDKTIKHVSQLLGIT